MKKLIDLEGKIYAFIKHSENKDGVVHMIRSNLGLFSLNEGWSCKVEYHTDTKAFIIEGDEDFMELYLETIYTLD